MRYDEDTNLEKMHSHLLVNPQVTLELTSNRTLYAKYHFESIRRYMAFKRLSARKLSTYENVVSALTMFDTALDYKKL